VKPVRSSAAENDPLQALDLAFEWKVISKALMNLSEKQFGFELVPAELPLPYPFEINKDHLISSFQVFENGQVQGELTFDLHWTRNAEANNWATFYPLQRGVAGLQKPKVVIAAQFVTDSSDNSLDHPQLVSLLHQFGHFLHHQSASKQHWFSNAGIAGEAEYVEAPALLLEYWAWSPKALQIFLSEPLTQAQSDNLKQHQELVRQDLRQELYAYAVSLEAWFEQLNPQTIDLPVAPINNRYLNYDHCLIQPDLAYRCLVAMDIAWDLVNDFIRFDFNDKQTANKLRENVLAEGASRPAMDILSSYFNRSFSLY